MCGLLREAFVAINAGQFEKAMVIYGGSYEELIDLNPEINPDGSLFVLGPCCWSTETDFPPQSQFEFTVLRVPQTGNIYLVQQLPIYVP